MKLVLQQVGTGETLMFARPREARGVVLHLNYLPLFLLKSGAVNVQNDKNSGVFILYQCFSKYVVCSVSNC